MSIYPFKSTPSPTNKELIGRQTTAAIESVRNEKTKKEDTPEIKNLGKDGILEQRAKGDVIETTLKLKPAPGKPGVNSY